MASPIGVLGGAGLVAATSTVLTQSFYRILESSLKNSIHRSSWEQVFLKFAPEKRASMKVMIDGAVPRIAGVLGAVGLFVVVHLDDRVQLFSSPSWPVWVLLPAAAAWVVATISLGSDEPPVRDHAFEFPIADRPFRASVRDSKNSDTQAAMGLFDGLFKKKTTTPESLRRRLLDTAASGDRDALVTLCRENAAAIEENIEDWKTVPDEYRDDPAKLDWYGRGLIAVAELFVHEFQNPALIQVLSDGGTDGNVIVEFQNQMQAIDQHVERGEIGEAQSALEALLPKVEGLSGGQGASMLAMTLGRLGDCAFQTKRADEALERFRQAHAVCEKTEDLDGVRAYLSSEMESLRWLDRHEEAAAVARKIAAICRERGDDVRAHRFDKRADVMANGEPLARIVMEIDGRTYELDELPDGTPDGPARAIFERNRLTLQPAHLLTEAGRRHGSAGEYESALTCFEAAAEADPHDPHCHYERAYTLMMLERTVEATEAYEKAESLAPGWFNTRADLWLAREATSGRINSEQARAVLLVEEVQDEDARLAMAKMLTETTPNIPHAWLMYARANPEEAAEAIARGLACDGPDDIRSRLLFARAMNAPAEHREDLETIVTMDAHKMTSAMARLVLKTLS